MFDKNKTPESTHYFILNISSYFSFPPFKSVVLQSSQCTHSVVSEFFANAIKTTFLILENVFFFFFFYF